MLVKKTMFYTIVRFGIKIGRGRELQAFVDLRKEVARDHAEKGAKTVTINVLSETRDYWFLHHGTLQT